MKFIYCSIGLSTLLLGSCTKKVGQTYSANSSIITPTLVAPHPCIEKKDSVVAYTTTVKYILQTNCLPCHEYPGTGGINLDTYNSAVSIANGGELLQVITNTDSNNVTMPPYPQKHLDSCEIKAINLWIKHGCSLN
jgi:mono/diheme cytochrome c family protein